MPGICTNAVRDGGGDCEHLTLTVNLDGVSHTVKTGVHDHRWNVALDADEQDLMLRLLARWWKGKGGSLANFVGRVLAGEEGTNVRQYVILAKDVTKTNIGTSYVNVCVGASGERSLVDFTGCTQYRLILNLNAIGTGPWGARIIRDSDSAVLHDTGNLTGAGEKEIDTDWQTLPAAASGLILVRLQGKSVTAADDPVFRRCILMVR